MMQKVTKLRNPWADQEGVLCTPGIIIALSFFFCSFVLVVGHGKDDDITTTCNCSLSMAVAFYGSP